ncbi:MAG: DUF2442 domain-containing protein [Parachlamydiaceae bacterium]
MLHIVKQVEYLNEYRLKLLFNDGKSKVIDFEARLKNAKNMFLPLKDVNYFKKVKSDGTTLVWPNGLDLCPDVLYEIGEEVPKQEKQKQPRARRCKKVGL